MPSAEALWQHYDVLREGRIATWRLRSILQLGSGAEALTGAEVDRFVNEVQESEGGYVTMDGFIDWLRSRQEPAELGQPPLLVSRQSSWLQRTSSTVLREEEEEEEEEEGAKGRSHRSCSSDECGDGDPKDDPWKQRLPFKPGQVIQGQDIAGRAGAPQQAAAGRSRSHRYRMLRVLSNDGGFSSVWLCVDLDSREYCAAKICMPSKRHDAKRQDALEEIRLLERLVVTEPAAGTGAGAESQKKQSPAGHEEHEAELDKRQQAAATLLQTLALKQLTKEEDTTSGAMSRDEAINILQDVTLDGLGQEAAVTYVEAEQRKDVRGGMIPKSQCVQLLDSFELAAKSTKTRCSDRSHVVLVFELLGDNLLTVLRVFRGGIPLAIVRRIAFDILAGVAALHGGGASLSMIHTDIKPENLCVAPNLDLLGLEPIEPHHDLTVWPPTVGQPDKAVKAPSTIAPDTGDPLPHQTEDPLPNGGRSKREIRDPYLTKVVDVGNAELGADPLDARAGHVAGTRQYRSPEVILGAAWGAPSDVWSVASLIFELVTEDYLFNPRAGRGSSSSSSAGSTWTADEDHLAQCIELLGPIPADLVRAGKYSTKFFTEVVPPQEPTESAAGSTHQSRLRGNGPAGGGKSAPQQLKHIVDMHPWLLGDVLKGKYGMVAGEADALAAFLLPMLHLAPNRRASAAEMLSHPWLRGAGPGQSSGASTRDHRGDLHDAFDSVDQAYATELLSVGALSSQAEVPALKAQLKVHRMQLLQ